MRRMRAHGIAAASSLTRPARRPAARSCRRGADDVARSRQTARAVRPACRRGRRSRRRGSARDPRRARTRSPRSPARAGRAGWGRLRSARIRSKPSRPGMPMSLSTTSISRSPSSRRPSLTVAAATGTAPTFSSSTLSISRESGSSSMTRIESPRSVVASSAARVPVAYPADVAVAVASRRQGNEMVKVAPWPGPSLAASTCPPCIWTSCRTMDRPRPRPPADGPRRRRRRGSDRRRPGRSAGAMPMPVSETARCTNPSCCQSRTRICAAVRRELDGVAEQVAEDLLKSRRVAIDGHAAASSRRCGSTGRAPRPPAGSIRRRARPRPRETPAADRAGHGRRGRGWRRAYGRSGRAAPASCAR